MSNNTANLTKSDNKLSKLPVSAASGGIQVMNTSISKIIDKVNKTRLIACTVLAASKDPIVSNFKSDWCIIDEAGQISLPAVIGALLQSNKFVLVGDEYQVLIRLVPL